LQQGKARELKIIQMKDGKDLGDIYCHTCVGKNQILPVCNTSSRKRQSKIKTSNKELIFFVRSWRHKS
jgi:hypothetical protein